MTTIPTDVSSSTRLAMTAWWTAAARARESCRSDRLFHDPWAAILVGLQSAEDYERAIGGDAVDDLHAVTTRFFDEFVLGASKGPGIRQVVLVACGLDTRAYRLNWPNGTRMFELDQRQVMAYKNCILTLNDARPRCSREAIAVDLNEPFADQLVAAGFAPAEPSVWVVEQCLYFFDSAAVHSLFASITQLSAPGSRLGFDIVNRGTVTSPATRHWSDRMTVAGAPWLFTSDEPDTLLEGPAWSTTVREPGIDEADFGRYPYVTGPRSQTDPRSFLVTATRSRGLV